MTRWNRRESLLLLGAAAVPVPALASDPWTAKKPADWTEKELQHLLNDSPWAKSVSITIGASMPMDSGGGGGRGRRGGGGIPAQTSADSSASMGGSPMGASTGGRGISNDAPMAAPSIVYTVRWMSARPMKLALVYSRMGAEAATSPQARSFIEKEDDLYVLNVSAPPRPGQAVQERRRQLSPQVEAEIKEGTMLSWKGHDKVHPLVVQIAQTNTFGFSFSFPKTHPIELDDKEVEFSSKLGEIVIRRKFRLKDMMYDGKLAL